MPCNITIDSIVGMDLDTSGFVQTIEVSGRASCRSVVVDVPDVGRSVVANVEDGRYAAVFQNVGPRRIKCNDSIKITAYCREDPSCKAGNGPLPVVCSLNPKYVSYYSCAGWNSNVEVMNLQNRNAKFTITVYGRNGSRVWRETIAAEAHETKRIQLDDHAPRKEGLVVVEPAISGDEFPSMLCITSEKPPPGLGQKEITLLQRFVPFIRVP